VVLVDLQLLRVVYKILVLVEVAVKQVIVDLVVPESSSSPTHQHK